jgi:hydrogenase expression/formation protein HypC
MCLAIPGQVTAIEEGQVPLMGTVNFAGIEKRVCLDWVPDVRRGQYVIVHVGFGIATVDEAEALKTLALARAMSDAAAKERGSA